MLAVWTNPFTLFLRNAHAAYRTIPRQPEIHTDPSLHSSFKLVSEDRRFVFDIVDRIEAVAAAFDRLHVLCKMYLRSQDKTDAVIEKQRLDDPSRVHFEVPESEKRKRDQYEWEAFALAVFACYEISVIVALKVVFAQPSSHLEYLVGVRNKILVHARRDGFVKTRLLD